MNCARCRVALPADGGECCAWCSEVVLCMDCWDAHGECGHPEFAEYHAMAEEARTLAGEPVFCIHPGDAAVRDWPKARAELRRYMDELKVAS